MRAADPKIELRARSGRPVLLREPGGELDPARLNLPDPLLAALREWATVVETVQHEDSTRTAELVSRRGRHLALRLAAATGAEVSYLDPLNGRRDQFGSRADRDLPPPEETPWGTGLAVTGIVGALVATILMLVTLGMADINIVLAVVINLGIAAGFAPSVWFGRSIPAWRWVVFGIGAGVVAAWLGLVLSLLG